MTFKINILKLTPLFVLFYSQVIAQTSEELINALYSENPLDVTFAIEAISEQQIYEALPAINELFESQPPFLQLAFLHALLVLDDADVETKALYVISIADEYANYDPPFKYDPLDAKAKATLVLIEMQNYSTVNYIFERIERDQPNYDGLSLTVLEIILNQYYPYEMQARTELENILNSLPYSSSEKYEAFCILIDKYGWQFQDQILDIFVNADYLPIKLKALEYLIQFNYSELNSLLKERIETEEYWSLRVDIADSLLQKFGEPSDLKTVIDYQPNEPNETAKSLIGFSIEEFIPPKPALNWSGLITKLISYTTEMYQYGWVANTQTRDYYITKLNLLNSQITSGRYKDACSTLNKALLVQIEKDLATNKITTEGYKFLHYYCVYIKEEFPGPLPCL
ncbi:MAG: hypothetical protein HND39_05820 [Ignavibacteriota bacterium]|jgi:hypothetical protein|nr:MAG: hypothetical protein EDM72_00260 [Chlorobiota bacterium]MBE7475781.1 hypothetical protein [Ignavibacteriales bacterium]MBL1122914.1 hypothetical protein [Ignavibacteriota bacterium]MCC7094600.1 hypothetical protein [Ignavibacteriaceae bacterium]MCE7856167.1 hypothetical protein [Ignavibacteria bacterium CHB3]MEB2295780.1 hypothetical protein [Ignavibacteria bacterium]